MITLPSAILEWVTRITQRQNPEHSSKYFDILGEILVELL